ncbi:MAG: DJ-1/PfpI/YhbO family deglycase/protease, partial [Thermomicrobiales bacterium]|nr:DJ-1/PfpI/YhbO family deglycase/protease [Thermomicrobiales bacterium]
TAPVEALEAAGADVVLIGIESGSVKGKKGAVLDTDTTFDQLPADAIDSFDMLVIPGGGAPENLRIVDAAVDFTRRFVDSGKPVASICHGPQLLISAEVLKGRKTTSVNKIRDDIKNAGGLYEDAPLVVDGNLISSRTPRDMDVFNQAIVDALGAVGAQ